MERQAERSAEGTGETDNVPISRMQVCGAGLLQQQTRWAGLDMACLPAWAHPLLQAAFPAVTCLCRWWKCWYTQGLFTLHLDQGKQQSQGLLSTKLRQQLWRGWLILLVWGIWARFSNIYPTTCTYLLKIDYLSLKRTQETCFLLILVDKERS